MPAKLALAMAAVAGGCSACSIVYPVVQVTAIVLESPSITPISVRSPQGKIHSPGFLPGAKIPRLSLDLHVPAAR